MANTVGIGKSGLSERILRFFQDHPTYVKAYVPTIVTASLVMQVVQGVRGWC